MQKFATLSDAIALAEFAHRNQIDKAGLPYIEHPRRVLAKVQARGGLPYVQIAAILHDVTEDTRFTPDMLLELGFSEAAVEVIKLVDRNESERLWYSFAPDGMDKDTYYYTQIRKNPGAKMVKGSDIEDNLSAWRLSYLPYQTQARLVEKYRKAKEILNE
jgi:(p)ppGpp synthase/HD superfamily hydrolase